MELRDELKELADEIGEIDYTDPRRIVVALSDLVQLTCSLEARLRKLENPDE